MRDTVISSDDHAPIAGAFVAPETVPRSSAGPLGIQVCARGNMCAIVGKHTLTAQPSSWTENSIRAIWVPRASPERRHARRHERAGDRTGTQPGSLRPGGFGVASRAALRLFSSTSQPCRRDLATPSATVPTGSCQRHPPAAIQGRLPRNRSNQSPPPIRTGSPIPGFGDLHAAVSAITMVRTIGLWFAVRLP